MLLDGATEGYLLAPAMPEGATTLVGLTSICTNVLWINAGGNVSSSVLASILLLSPVVLVPPALPPPPVVGSLCHLQPLADRCGMVARETGDVTTGATDVTSRVC